MQFFSPLFHPTWQNFEIISWLTCRLDKLDCFDFEFRVDFGKLVLVENDGIDFDWYFDLYFDLYFDFVHDFDDLEMNNWCKDWWLNLDHCWLHGNCTGIHRGWCFSKLKYWTAERRKKVRKNKQKWYFVNKIDLTYCEKTLF